MWTDCVVEKRGKVRSVWGELFGGDEELGVKKRLFCL